jgi:hypothetical protein
MNKEVVKCKKKSYCIYYNPEIEANSIIINKLEQGEVYRAMHKKDIWSPRELEALKRKYPEKYQYLVTAYNNHKCYNSNNGYVVRGTAGELWVISEDKLVQKYEQTENQPNVPFLTEINDGRGDIDEWWVPIVTKTGNDAPINYAYRLPVGQQMEVKTSWAVLLANDPNVEHGKGDWIVAADPEFKDQWVVNGLIFDKTYQIIGSEGISSANRNVIDSASGNGSGTGNIDDRSSYKQCKKKLFTRYICIPRIGTQVFNKLEKSQYTTNQQKPFVICGTIGELWTIDFTKLMKTYTFADGTPITIASINRRMKTVDTGNMHFRVMDWIPVQSKPDAGINWACFVPNGRTGKVLTQWGETLEINSAGNYHGYGDFVVTADDNGKPSMRDRWVVNGGVFATTYNNKGWTQFLDPKASNIDAGATKQHLPNFDRLLKTGRAGF